MASLSEIKNWFKTGLKPTQTQFWITWDSFWHKDTPIPQSAIENLEETLASVGKGRRFGIEDKTTPENIDRVIDMGANFMKFKNVDKFIVQGAESLQFMQPGDDSSYEMTFYPVGGAILPDLTGYGVLTVSGMDSLWPEEVDVYFYDTATGEIETILDFEKYLIPDYNVYLYRRLGDYTGLEFSGAIIPVVTESNNIYLNPDNYGTLEAGDWVYGEDTLGRLVRRTYETPALPSYPEVTNIYYVDDPYKTWGYYDFTSASFYYLENNTNGDCNWTIPGQFPYWSQFTYRTITIVAKGHRVTINGIFYYKDGIVNELTTDGTLTLSAFNGSANPAWYVINEQSYTEGGGGSQNLQQVLEVGAAASVVGTITLQSSNEEDTESATLSINHSGVSMVASNSTFTNTDNMSLISSAGSIQLSAISGAGGDAGIVDLNGNKVDIAGANGKITVDSDGITMLAGESPNVNGQHIITGIFTTGSPVYANSAGVVDISSLVGGSTPPLQDVLNAGSSAYMVGTVASPKTITLMSQQTDSGSSPTFITASGVKGEMVSGSARVTVDQDKAVLAAGGNSLTLNTSSGTTLSAVGNTITAGTSGLALTSNSILSLASGVGNNVFTSDSSGTIVGGTTYTTVQSSGVLALVNPAGNPIEIGSTSTPGFIRIDSEAFLQNATAYSVTNTTGPMLFNSPYSLNVNSRYAVTGINARGSNVYADSDGSIDISSLVGGVGGVASKFGIDDTNTTADRNVEFNSYDFIQQGIGELTLSGRNVSFKTIPANEGMYFSPINDIIADTSMDGKSYIRFSDGYLDFFNTPITSVDATIDIDGSQTEYTFVLDADVYGNPLYSTSEFTSGTSITLVNVSLPVDESKSNFRFASTSIGAKPAVEEVSTMDSESFPFSNGENPYEGFTDKFVMSFESYHNNDRSTYPNEVSVIMSIDGVEQTTPTKLYLETKYVPSNGYVMSYWTTATIAGTTVFPVKWLKDITKPTYLKVYTREAYPQERGRSLSISGDNEVYISSPSPQRIQDLFNGVSEMGYPNGTSFLGYDDFGNPLGTGFYEVPYSINLAPNASFAVGTTNYGLSVANEEAYPTLGFSSGIWASSSYHGFFTSNAGFEVESVITPEVKTKIVGNTLMESYDLTQQIKSDDMVASTGFAKDGWVSYKENPVGIEGMGVTQYNNITGATELQLPSALYKGKRYVVKNSTNAVVTIDAGEYLIDGLGEYLLYPNQVIEIVSSGSDEDDSTVYHVFQRTNVEITDSTTTTAHTASSLNTAYPNIPNFSKVYCTAITGLPAIYVKTTTAGQWMNTVDGKVLNP